MEQIELILSITSLAIGTIAIIVSTYFAILAKFSSLKSNRLSELGVGIAEECNEIAETQKILAMISILSPVVGDDKEAWRMFMKYLIRQRIIPFVDDEDHQFMHELMHRLEIKIKINEDGLISED